MAGGLEKFFGLFRTNKPEAKTSDSKTDPIIESGNGSSGTEQYDKRYGREDPPTRQFYFWGWDKNHNPAFLVLYGEHKFKESRSGDNLLEDQVVYTEYMVFQGQEGHFPSFEAVKIWNRYDYNTRKYKKNMYYKKDVRGYSYWQAGDDTKPVEGYGILKEGITIPYFGAPSYEACVEILRKSNNKFAGFQLADTKNDVLKLPPDLQGYYESLCHLFSNPNLYMRRKHLSLILDMTPSKALYQYLLTTGSGELLSGLFLELSHREDAVLADEARELINHDLTWVTKRYAKGLKRCLTIYLNILNPQVRTERTQWIREHLPEMDLKLLIVNGKKIPDDKILEGIHYQRYAAQQAFAEYSGRYIKEKGKYKYIRERKSGIFAKNHYWDGVVLDLLAFKNTVQEAEAYKLADVIGKIAYYLDAPRLTSYLSGSGNGGALRYHRRYLRRVIDVYSKTDEAKYVQAIKELVTSYTSGDYLNVYQGNFQYNYFIKYYLYHEYKGQKPSGWRDAYEWVSSDQLKKLAGRYEYMPEIWDRHPDDVLEILCKAKIEVVLKAFYYIFDGMQEKESYIQNLSYEKLILLMESPYAPVSSMFKGILKQRLALENQFNSDLMLTFMNSENPEVRDLATEYFKRTNGKFPADQLIRFMFLDHAMDWISLLAENLSRLDTGEYGLFLTGVVAHIQDFEPEGDYDSEEFCELMEQSLTKMNELSTEMKVQVIDLIIRNLASIKREAGFLPEFLEKVIFSSTLSQLKELLVLVDVEVDQSRNNSRSRLIISVLTAIKKEQLLPDYQVLEILAKGTSKMIKVFGEMAVKQQDQLCGRHSTLLLFMESEMVVLNRLMMNIFERLEAEEQKKLHMLLIDSPDKKTYDFALVKLQQIYEKQEAMIPREFVMQMLEHPAYEVRAYVTDKMIRSIENLGNGNQGLFLYYVKTLLYLPNKISAAKQRIYQLLPIYVEQHQSSRAEVEKILFDLGNSNIISDAEQALVALAQIRKGGVVVEG